MASKTDWQSIIFTIKVALFGDVWDTYARFQPTWHLICPVWFLHGFCLAHLNRFDMIWRLRLKKRWLLRTFYARTPCRHMLKSSRRILWKRRRTFAPMLLVLAAKSSGETRRETWKHTLQWEQRQQDDAPSAETKVFYVARRQSKGLQASKAPKTCHFRWISLMSTRQSTARQSRIARYCKCGVAWLWKIVNDGPRLSKVANGLAAFLAVFLFMGSFVLCCLRCIKRVEQWEESLGLKMLFLFFSCQNNNILFNQFLAWDELDCHSHITQLWTNHHLRPMGSVAL